MAIHYVELQDGEKALVIDEKEDNHLICRSLSQKVLRDFLNGNSKAVKNRCVYSEEFEKVDNSKLASLTKSKIATLSVKGIKVYDPKEWKDSLISMRLMCQVPGCIGLLGTKNKSGYCKNCTEKSPARRNRLSYSQRLQQENLGEYLKIERAISEEALKKVTPDVVEKMIQLFGEDKVDTAIQLAILATPIYAQEIKLNPEVIGKIVQIISDEHFNKLGHTWNPIAIEDSWMKLQKTAHDWMDGAGLSDWKKNQILNRMKLIYLPENFTP